MIDEIIDWLNFMLSHVPGFLLFILVATPGFLYVWWWTEDVENNSEDHFFGP